MEKLLEDWSIVCLCDASEASLHKLAGKVFGDETRTPGKKIITSAIVGKTGEMVKTKSGSLYRLGKVDPDYEAAFPDAKKRLFESLPNDT